MDINDAFPSKYLKASDLQGRQPTVTIDRIIIEEVGKDKDRRPCIYFQGKEKGIVLNKTNATNIGASYGSNTDAWVGRPVTLFTVWTDFNGQSVEAIRVRPAAQQPQAQQPVQQQAPNFRQAPQQPVPAHFDNPPPHTSAPPFAGDDVPFLYEWRA